LHNRTDLDDRDRLIRKIEIERARQSPSGSIPEKPFVNAGIFGIHWERDVLRQRIARRLAKRIDEGMIEEVSRLHLQGLPWERLDSFGLEYRYVAMYLQNKLTLTEMSAKLQIAIGQFAKRQMTWFRRMEKKGVKIEWVSGDNYADLHRRVLKVLS
jgi:tRNA dimethylallyltransferase